MRNCAIKYEYANLIYHDNNTREWLSKTQDLLVESPCTSRLSVAQFKRSVEYFAPSYTVCLCDNIFSSASTNFAQDFQLFFEPWRWPTLHQSSHSQVSFPFLLLRRFSVLRTRCRRGCSQARAQSRFGFCSYGTCLMHSFISPSKLLICTTASSPTH